MKRLFCDRCGKEILDDESLKKIIHIERVHRILFLKDKTKEETFEQLLCDDCGTDFIRWFMSKKKEETKND